jgi:hypothetical protein
LCIYQLSRLPSSLLEDKPSQAKPLVSCIASLLILDCISRFIALPKLQYYDGL